MTYRRDARPVLGKGFREYERFGIGFLVLVLDAGALCLGSAYILRDYEQSWVPPLRVAAASAGVYLIFKHFIRAMLFPARHATLLAFPVMVLLLAGLSGVLGAEIAIGLIGGCALGALDYGLDSAWAKTCERITVAPENVSPDE